MKNPTRFLLLLATTVAMPAIAQTMYQWKDPKSGNMIYSDQAPPPGIKAQGVHEGKEPGENRQQSYATRIAAEKYPVVLYTSTDCGEQCFKAREALNGRGIPFSEKSVQGDGPELTELKSLTGGEAIVPLLLVGSQRFKGFAPDAWNNLLDLAGYPKSAPPGSRPSGGIPR